MPNAGDQPHARSASIEGYDTCWGSYGPWLAGQAADGASPGDLVKAIDDLRGRYLGFIREPIRQQIAHLDLSPFRVRREPYRLGVVAGHYVALKTAQNSQVLFDQLVRTLDPAVDCVVEFGSGLGYNLARLRSLCPGLNPTYLACEPSANGREITARFFTNDPDIRLEVRDFDFTQSSLDFLSPYRNVVAFTCHAIEQIAVLGDAFYRRLLDSPVTACFHFEPVGWQRFTNLVTTVETHHRDESLWAHHHNHYVYRIADDALSANAASWSSKCGYNTNLLKLVADAATRTEIRITALGYDLDGYNPFNPSTLIGWTRQR